MYRILLERSAERDLRRLSAKAHDRVIAAIRGLAAKPRPMGCRKLNGSENDRRIRVGNYRVVDEIADAVRVLRVNRAAIAARCIGDRKSKPAMGARRRQERVLSAGART